MSENPEDPESNSTNRTVPRLWPIRPSLLPRKNFQTGLQHFNVRGRTFRALTGHLPTSRAKSFRFDDASLPRTSGARTPVNGRGALILKKHLLSGQRPRQFVRIAPGLVKIFKICPDLCVHPFFGQNLSGSAGSGLKSTEEQGTSETHESEVQALK